LFTDETVGLLKKYDSACYKTGLGRRFERTGSMVDLKPVNVAEMAVDATPQDYSHYIE
jgi:hypothetical protein